MCYFIKTFKYHFIYGRTFNLKTYSIIIKPHQSPRQELLKGSFFFGQVQNVFLQVSARNKRPKLGTSRTCTAFLNSPRWKFDSFFQVTHYYYYNRKYPYPKLLPHLGTFKTSQQSKDGIILNQKWGMFFFLTWLPICCFCTIPDRLFFEPPSRIYFFLQEMHQVLCDWAEVHSCV